MADYEELIRNAIEFIEGRLTEKLDVDAAARQNHFSRHYYQKLFSALIGEPMMEYVKKGGFLWRPKNSHRRTHPSSTSR